MFNQSEIYLFIYLQNKLCSTKEKFIYLFIYKTIYVLPKWNTSVSIIFVRCLSFCSVGTTHKQPQGTYGLYDHIVSCVSEDVFLKERINTITEC
jgi:hypothetical protein